MARSDGGAPVSVPSIKGTAFQSVLEDVSKALKNGRIETSKLESATKAEDRDLLGEVLVPGIWYPLESYTRLLDLLWEVDGERDPQYLVDRGATAADRILAAGAYADMVETAGRWGGEQVVQSVLSLSKSLFNFVDVVIHGGIQDDQFEVAFIHTAAFPDCARYASQGFFQPLFERLAGRPVAIESHRHSDDELRFHVRHA
jgi:hypothetical protein